MSYEINPALAKPDPFVKDYSQTATKTNTTRVYFSRFCRIIWCNVDRVVATFTQTGNKIKRQTQGYDEERIKSSQRQFAVTSSIHLTSTMNLCLRFRAT